MDSLTIRLVSKAKGAYWVTVDGQPVPAPTSGSLRRGCLRLVLQYVRPHHLGQVPRSPKDDYDVVISTEKFDLVGMVKED